MRQWMVDPRIMCRQHLLGEHVEHHMFVGSINKGTSMDGYLRDGLLEPESLRVRHSELVAEMEARGYNHKSPLPDYILIGEPAIIDREVSKAELLRRCPECRERAERLYSGGLLPRRIA